MGKMALFGAPDSRVSWLAYWFHDIPHIDYTFGAVNSTFDPASNLYLESLGIIASVPGFWLILNLLAFLIFFLSRCCEREWKSKNLTCYKWALGFFAIFCCGALAFGFYGNDETHDGVETFMDAMRQINSIIMTVKNQTLQIEQTLAVDIKPKLDELDKIFRHQILNTTAQNLLQQAVQAMRMDVLNSTDTVDKLNSRIHELDLSSIYRMTHEIELFRWPITMSILIIFMLFCIILLAGIMTNSRSTLIAFTVLGLLAVILNWLLVSIYLASSVALGDLCIDPDLFILGQVGNSLEKSIVQFYLECTESKDNPFMQAITNGQKAIENVESKLKFLNKSYPYFYEDKDLPHIMIDLSYSLNVSERILGSISSLLACLQIHKQYTIAVTAACTPVLNGLAFMLLSATSAGLLFILLIWIAAHTWMYIRKRKTCAESDYVQVDEQDPFLPPSAVMVQGPTVGSRRSRDAPCSGRPRHSHTPPQTPPFPGAYNGRIPRGTEDHSPLHGRYTPPPSYEQLIAFLPTAPLKSS